MASDEEGPRFQQGVEAVLLLEGSRSAGVRAGGARSPAEQRFCFLVPGYLPAWRDLRTLEGRTAACVWGSVGRAYDGRGWSSSRRG